jgi:hypothetical protein
MQASEKISFLFASTLAVELGRPVVRDSGQTNKECVVLSEVATCRMRNPMYVDGRLALLSFAIGFALDWFILLRQ